MANGVYSREIQLRHGDRFLRAAGGNHAPPRVTDDGVAPCVVGRALVARGRGADGKNLVVDGALAEQQFPVRWPCRHVEGRGHEQHLRPAQRHEPRQFKFGQPLEISGSIYG